MNDPHRFCPELFEHRNQALEALSEAGFIHMGDFVSVSLEHDLYGLEVSGIPDRDTALEIEICLKHTFPDWMTPG